MPDVAIYRWDRIPLDADGEVADDFVEAPDVAVEILSPGLSIRGMEGRCRWFVDNGVRVAVAVTPRRRTVTEIRPDGRVTILTAGEVLDLTDVLPGLRLAIYELFGVLRFG